jgi:hypothetical protein
MNEFKGYSNETKKIINNPKFINSCEKFIENILSIFIEDELEFLISLNLDEIEAYPKIEGELYSHLKMQKYFILPIRSFSHFHILDKKIFFEIGLGLKELEEEEPVYYSLTIPFYSILHIISSDKQVIFENPLFHNSDLRIQEKINHSTNIFLSNPDNSSFLTKK